MKIKYDTYSYHVANIFTNMVDRTGSKTVIQPPASQSDTDEVALSKDMMFKMLSNRRRRLTVEFLASQPNANGGLTIRELSELNASVENELPVPEVTYKQRKRVHISLYQTHLQALDTNNIVDYDERSGAVTLLPTSREFSQYVDITSKNELGWAEVWLGLSAVCLAFGVATWTTLLPFFGSRPEIAVLAVSLVMGCAAVVFYYSSEQIRL